MISAGSFGEKNVYSLRFWTPFSQQPGLDLALNSFCLEPSSCQHLGDVTYRVPFLENSSSLFMTKVTRRVRVRSLSHWEIKIDVWKYIRTILIGLGTFWKEKLASDHPDRALSLKVQLLGQSRQTLDNEAPLTAEYVPTAHDVHVASCRFFWYFPATHWGAGVFGLDQWWIDHSGSNKWRCDIPGFKITI